MRRTWGCRRHGGRDAQAPCELLGPIDDSVECFRGECLRDGGRLKRQGPAVQIRAGALEERARRSKVDLVVGDHRLSNTVAGDRSTESRPLHDVLDGYFMCPGGCSAPAHDMGHSRRAETELRQPEPVVGLTEDVFVGDEDVPELHFAMATDHRLVHGADVSRHVQALGGRGDQEERRAALLTWAAGRPGHDDEEVGSICPGDEPLATSDEPTAGCPERRRTQQRGIGAGSRRRLGHREGRPVLSGRDRTQVSLALGFGCHLVEQVLIAFVGCVGVDGHSPEQRTSGGLEYRYAFTHAQTTPTELDGQVGTEDPCGHGFGL